MQTLPLPFSLLTECQQRNCRGVGSRAYFCYDTYKLSTVALFLLHRNRKAGKKKHADYSEFFSLSLTEEIKSTGLFLHI